MPSYIVKVDPDRDAYIVWSTVVESPTHFGTRADLQRHDPERYTDDRFERVRR